MTLKSTRPEPELRLMSTPGVAEPPVAAEAGPVLASLARRQSFRADLDSVEHTGAAADGAEDFFLPNFCGAPMVLAVVLISELLAVTFALARSPTTEFLTELARISLFVQWLGLTSAALLCCTRSWLARFSVPLAATAIFVLLLLNTALLSELTVWIGARLSIDGLGTGLFPQDHLSFLVRNEAICLIVAALLQRYFFVSHQWRHHVRAEARSRIHALQARIRPHFLFNSLNTIAALTRSDPARAEEAVEDLADLFRATLRDSELPLRLKAELELTRIYQRIEMLRLGDRLTVKWNVADAPMRALIPGLTIQPLLENAIYHGIEPLDGGGVVEVNGRREGVQVIFTVTNPIDVDRVANKRPGNGLALGNIRERLKLAYGDSATLEISESAEQYRVTVRFPFQE